MVGKASFGLESRIPDTLTSPNQLYHIYVDNYDNASELAANLLTSNRVFREALKAAGFESTFNSLLIRPVQQLPKYRLLLERLSSLTDDGHPDAKRLKMAEVKCGDVATHVNEFMHKKEAHAKVLAIQASFYPSQFFVQAGRSFVKEGDLIKHTSDGSSSRRYHFFLFSDAIAYGQQIFKGPISPTRASCAHPHTRK